MARPLFLSFHNLFPGKAIPKFYPLARVHQRIKPIKNTCKSQFFICRFGSTYKFKVQYLEKWYLMKFSIICY